MLVARQYQQEAVDNALAHMRSTTSHGVLVMTTGAGKSICIAMLAQVVKKAGKRVLCLCPNGDLVRQNASKYRATGEHCSLFSASLNRKHTGHPVVFATPLSVINALDDFSDEYALLIIDEAQGVGEDEDTAYQRIITHLTLKNPRLRVLGLTATPMRGKTKLIGKGRTFENVIYELPHGTLSDLGFVVPYSIGRISSHYDLAKLKVQSNGKFAQSEVDSETLGKERLTRKIIEDDLRAMDADGRKLAMVFAASIKHAEEIMSYLPEGSACLITGKTAKGERRDELEEARNGKWRFLVTVTALGTGTDVPLCDTIILLRATESIGALLQWIGRGCRLYDDSWSLPSSELNWKRPEYAGKLDCLIFDHGENIERFALDDDLTVTGLVDAKSKQEDGEFFEIECPECKTINRHTSQRCIGITPEGVRCSFRFIFKICPHCESHNSPSARYCWKCDGELIDPNEKLTRAAAVSIGTPFQVAVIEMSLRSHYKGDSHTLRVDYKCTDGSKTFTVSEFKKPGSYPWHRWTQAVGASGNTIDNVIMEADTLSVPTRLMVKRRKGSKWHEVVALYFDDVKMLDAA